MAKRMGKMIVRVDHTPCVLYVDILGTKERWFRSDGGPEAARRAVSAFRAALTKALSDGGIAARAATGVLNADGVALRFGSARRALDVGTRLFQICFEKDVGKNDRLWIRGVIAPCADDELVEVQRLDGWDRIVSRVPTPSVLEATIAEHSGFRGMRLLVHEDLLTDRTRQQLQVLFNGVPVERFMSLKAIADSDRVRSYEEVLWMLDDWPTRRAVMERRLRLAGRDANEFAQAAATALTFARCDLRVTRATEST